MAASAHRASDRYEILVKLASGGMGSVYVARMRGALGFRQLVAIKKPHPHLLEDAKARQAVVDEAKLTSAIRHVNVVTMRDVDHHDGEVALVMDYVEGGSIIDLLRDAPRIPVAIAIRIALDACAGLHAAHEATDETGAKLAIVHRDVSPHNIMVGTDGVTRVTDFGIAKSLGRGGEGADHSTTGGVKGKLAYMAPEYLQGQRADRRVDVFAMGAVLWEAIEGRRLFRAGNDLETLGRLLKEDLPIAANAGPSVNAVLTRALARDPANRYQTADEMAEALDQAAKADGHVATHREVGAFVKERVGVALEKRMNDLREAHKRRQQTTGSMSAIELPAPASPAASSASGVPAGFSRSSLTMDMGAAKGDFAAAHAAHSGLSAAAETPADVAHVTPSGVEESVAAPMSRPRPKSMKPLLVGALLAAVFGSAAAVVAFRLTTTPAAQPRDISTPSSGPTPGASLSPAASGSSEPSASAAATAVSVPTSPATAAGSVTAKPRPPAPATAKTRVNPYDSPAPP
ncbi:MAG: protein kinase [Polyangiaceae bacterium]